MATEFIRGTVVLARSCTSNEFDDEQAFCSKLGCNGRKHSEYLVKNSSIFC